MVSICIPIYNYTMRNLVEALHRQAVDLGIPFEILLIDDASDEEFREENRKLSVFSRYIELDKNIGRAKIRNLLAKEAKYENLLFLDCDVEISASFSLKKYLSVMGNDKVISGGHIYSTQPPEVDFRLHWRYGMKKEAKSCRFMSSNFFISKTSFSQTLFDESIQGYGYEDFLFEMELMRQQFAIFRINNPVIHQGLSSNRAFIEKAENGIRNLLQLWQQKLILPSEAKYARLLNTYCKINSLKINFLFRFIYKISGKKIRNHLVQKPNILLLEFYKLLYMCYIQRN